jgi:hypothetical protein
MGLWMNENSRTEKLRIVVLSFAALFFYVLSGFSASASQQGQQPPPSQEAQQSPQTSSPPPEAPKQKKVWTNEDVVSLRSPADIYQAEKEAREAAAAGAAAREAGEAKLPKEAKPTIKLPATPEETQQLIDAKEHLISDEQIELDRLNKELPGTPEEQKVEMQREIDRVADVLRTARIEEKTLRAHLQKLNKTKSDETTPAPTAPPSL